MEQEDQVDTTRIPTQGVLSYYFDQPQFDQDKPLYIDVLDEERVWSTNTVRKAVRQLAAGFKAAGLRVGDCVCIHSFNDVYYPIVVKGIPGFSGVFTGSNPAYTKYELVHHLKTADVRFVIVEPDLLTTLVSAADEISLTRENIFLFDNDGEPLERAFKSWITLLEHGECDWPRFNDLETAKNTPLTILRDQAGIEMEGSPGANL